MALRPKRPCRTPGCPGTTRDRYCERCTREKQPKETSPDNRPSAARRGYDRRWQRFRKRFLAKHPLCVDCESRGRVTPAVHVDHIVPLRDAPERKFDETNCQGLCHSCHSRKTARGA